MSPFPINLKQCALFLQGVFERSLASHETFRFIGYQITLLSCSTHVTCVLHEVKLSAVVIQITVLLVTNFTPIDKYYGHGG